MLKDAGFLMPSCAHPIRGYGWQYSMRFLSLNEQPISFWPLDTFVSFSGFPFLHILISLFMILFTHFEFCTVYLSIFSMCIAFKFSLSLSRLNISSTCWIFMRSCVCVAVRVVNAYANFYCNRIKPTTPSQLAIIVQHHKSRLTFNNSKILH